MKTVSDMGWLYRISDRGWRIFLTARAAGSDASLTACGARQIGSIDKNVTDMTDEDAQFELESLPRKAKR